MIFKKFLEFREPLDICRRQIRAERSEDIFKKVLGRGFGGNAPEWIEGALPL